MPILPTIVPCRACAPPIDCTFTSPLDLYRLEGPEFPFVLNCPSGYNCNLADQIRMDCCGQELVDVFPTGATQAQRDAITQALIGRCQLLEEFCGGPHTEFFYNRPQSFQAGCPGGGIFSFTVPAGMFLADSQEEADRLATIYAARQGRVDNFCVTVPGICPCKSAPSSFTLRITGGTGPFTATVTTGVVPTGMSFSVSGRNVILSGTPSVSATFTFGLRITDALGATWNNSITAHVLAIATTTLTDFEQGVPYSFQLQASGGSGSYAWKITSGSLPAGLEMNIGGLITGTPTSNVTGSFTVEMIDLACQSTDRTFFPPRVRLVGHSVTTIATVKGFDEFAPFISSPPKKYMVRTYTTSMSGDDAAGNAVEANEGLSAYLFASGSGQLAYALTILSGSDQINAAGTTISTATVALFSSCPGPNNVQPLVISNDVAPYGGGYPMPGWCFNYDISYSFTELPSPTYPTCSGCNFPLLADGSIVPTNLFHGRGNVTSSTHQENITEGEQLLGCFGCSPDPDPTFMPFPPNLGYPHLQSPTQTARMRYKHAYAIDLSTEYTDALALANATILNQNGLIALTMPRTTGFVSTWTTVSFDLNCSNLVFGETYILTVDFRDDANNVTSKTYNFTAAATTHTITDTVATPPAGHTLEVRNPRIVFGI